MTHNDEPWAPPADWGEWISILLAARKLGVSRDTIDNAPIRSARVGHRTVIVNVADLADWVNASLRSRYISPATDAAPPEPAPVHRRYGAVVNADTEVA